MKSHYAWSGHSCQNSKLPGNTLPSISYALVETIIADIYRIFTMCCTLFLVLGLIISPLKPRSQIPHLGHSLSLTTVSLTPTVSCWNVPFTLLFYLKYVCCLRVLYPPQPHWVAVQSLSRVWPFATPGTAAHQVSLSFTISQSLLKLMSVESVMPSNHPVL